MAKIKYDEVDKVVPVGAGGYFTLKDDGDIAQVRFLYDDDNFDIYAVHEVEFGGNSVYVECPMHDRGTCALCDGGLKPFVKVFIALEVYDPSTKKWEPKVWERGRTYAAKLGKLHKRFGKNGGLVSNIFEIERNGAKGDTNTTYEFYHIEEDGCRMDETSGPIDILGTIVKLWDERKMLQALNGQNPDEEQAAPPSRRSRRNIEEEAPPTSRRRRAVVDEPEDEPDEPDEPAEDRQSLGRRARRQRTTF